MRHRPPLYATANRPHRFKNFLVAPSDRFKSFQAQSRLVGYCVVLVAGSSVRISNALNLELIGIEAARSTDHPDAPDYILRARAALNRGTHVAIIPRLSTC